jgi:hypothetical protein
MLGHFSYVSKEGYVDARKLPNETAERTDQRAIEDGGRLVAPGRKPGVKDEK